MVCTFPGTRKQDVDVSSGRATPSTPAAASTEEGTFNHHQNNESTQGSPSFSANNTPFNPRPAASVLSPPQSTVNNNSLPAQTAAPLTVNETDTAQVPAPDPQQGSSSGHSAQHNTPVPSPSQGSATRNTSAAENMQVPSSVPKKRKHLHDEVPTVYTVRSQPPGRNIREGSSGSHKPHSMNSNAHTNEPTVQGTPPMSSQPPKADIRAPYPPCHSDRPPQEPEQGRLNTNIHHCVPILVPTTSQHVEMLNSAPPPSASPQPALPLAYRVIETPPAVRSSHFQSSRSFSHC